LRAAIHCATRSRAAWKKTTYAAALTIPDGQHHALSRIANTT
jgi:hypothetical protein